MMWKAFIRLGNYAHRQRAAIRRPTIVFCMLAMALTEFAWILLMPLFWVFYPPFMAVKAFLEAVGELFPLTINQFESDWRDWEINWSGAQRVWRYRKEHPHD